LVSIIGIELSPRVSEPLARHPKATPGRLQSSFHDRAEGVSPQFIHGGLCAMAMTMNGEVQLAAPREIVWARLNDAETLKACIPGCEELIKLSDTEMTAVATTKIGPVKARFKGNVHLSDLDPPNGYRISGEGDGGVAGFAKGGATVSLSEKDGGTLLSYNVEAQIGGKLAQLGQRLVNGAAKKIADDFFANFAKLVGGAAPSDGVS
jgi:carbon monoxide dehydrogenase subunit G